MGDPVGVLRRAKGTGGSRARDVAPANEKAGIWKLKRGWRYLPPTSIFTVPVSIFRTRVAQEPADYCSSNSKGDNVASISLLSRITRSLTR